MPGWRCIQSSSRGDGFDLGRHVTQSLITARGEKGLGGNKLKSYREFLGIHINGENFSSAAHLGSLDDIEANSSATEHDYGATGFHLGCVHDRTKSCHHPTTNDAG